VEPDEALAELGLISAADPALVRRTYRRLARSLHPDRGGDAAAFARVHAAYRTLTAGPTPEPTRARVARGRPSRSPAPGSPVPPLRPDTDALEQQLRGQVLAAIRTGSRRTVTLDSRAPGSRLNRHAVMLAAVSTSELRMVAVPRAAAGRTDVGVEIVLEARSRAARRALAVLDPRAPELGDAGWRRERGEARTLLRCTIAPAQAEAVVTRAAQTVAALLQALAWPPDEWRIGATAGPVPPPTSGARPAA